MVVIAPCKIDCLQGIEGKGVFKGKLCSGEH